MNSCTVVVPGIGDLHSLCGANDSNLLLIENYLHVPIYTKGNEIYIVSDDKEVCQKFQFVIDRIIDEIKDGVKNPHDAIVSVLNLNNDETYSNNRLDKSILDKTSIVVPGAIRKIYPRTRNQAKYVSVLRSYDMTVCTGSAGSGKTFLAVAEALRLLLAHDKSKLIVTRPVVEAGESLGFLPGDLEQKLNPYLRPLYDAMESILPCENVHKLLETGIIETAPLAYMRGRTLNDSVIILDEAQNTTKEQMKMFLTRMGENSKIFITGDVTQIDLPKKTQSGLVHALKLLKHIEEIGLMELTAEDVVRNPLVRKIVKAYENEEENER